MFEITAIGFVTAFVAGMVSFLSPCVLPLVPGYVSYISGQSVGQSDSRDYRANPEILGLSACFVLGFSTVFVLLGASATALGSFLLAYRYEANLIGGAMVIAFGLFTAGLLEIPALQREFRWQGPATRGGALSAYLLGLAFAFGWTPCIGPVLGSILALTSTTPTSNGTILLTVYSLGLGIPFIMAALFTDSLMAQMRRIRRLGRALQILAGLGMVAMGLAMITGRLTDFASWLLKTFPALATIG